MEKRILEIDAKNGSSSLKTIDEKDMIGVLDYAVTDHTKSESYKHGVLSPDNAFIFGVGPLAGSRLVGTNRLIFVAHSPTVETLFISTLGGAGIPLYKSGVDFVKVEGKSDELSILLIKNIAGELKTEFRPILKESLIEIYEKDKRGVYALQDYVLDNFKEEFMAGGKYADFRILTVGPAALTTNMSGIYSQHIRNGEFEHGAEGWAGRGGFGSVLAQAHGIVAIVYGGDQDFRKFPGEDLKDAKVLNQLFKDFMGKPMSEVMIEATAKYRFDEKKNTGGTFGSNMASLGTWLPMFNWSSIYMPAKKRQALYDKFVKAHYLEQFNKETIETKNWTTCGEPCPARCKKVNNGMNKDYEPYEALGPNCGIFDQRDAEATSLGVESMGFDAIGFGTLASFVMECMSQGLLTKEDVGVDVDPVFDPDRFTLEDSKKHAKIAIKLAHDVAYQETEFSKMFVHGIRYACKALSQKYPDREAKANVRFSDLANYVPFGKDGYVAPCQYWVPGFYIPLPVQGKFHTYYGKDFFEPRDLGAKSIDRGIKEMFSENTGICRFHREWSEKLVENFINEGYKTNVNYYEHCKKLTQMMRDYDIKAGVVPEFWETQRTKDIIRTYINEAIASFGASEQSLRWKKMFDNNAEMAARRYWHDLLAGVNQVIDWGDMEKIVRHCEWS